MYSLFMAWDEIKRGTRCANSLGLTHLCPSARVTYYAFYSVSTVSAQKKNLAPDSSELSRHRSRLMEMRCDCLRLVAVLRQEASQALLTGRHGMIVS